MTLSLRKMLSGLLALILAVGLVSGCDSQKETLQFEGETLPIELEIDCDGNLIFSRYDLDVLVEGVEVGRLSHGSKDIFAVDLPVGQYSLELHNAGDSGVKGVVRFKVEEAGLLHFRASCNRDRVNVEQKFPELEAAEAVAAAKEEEQRKAEEQERKAQEEAEEKTQAEQAAAEAEQATAEEEAHRAAEEEKQQRQEREKAEVMALKGKDVSAFMKECKTLGYSYRMRHYETDSDFSDYFDGNDLDDPKNWKVVKIKNVDVEKKSVLALIGNKEMIKEKKKAASAKEKLEEKLPAICAWQAADAYGESAYPYGFKLHYWMDNMAEEARDGNTWFLKAGCDVKNEYGVWEKGLTCEALVSGTESNPVVESFNVY